MKNMNTCARRKCKKTNIVVLCKIFLQFTFQLFASHVYLYFVLFLQLRNTIRNLIALYADLNQIYITFMRLSQFLMYRITV